MAIHTKKYIEEYIKIRDKNSNIVQFKLNEPQQRLYNIIADQKELEKPVRIIILKARQMGFSTLTEAIIFKITATNMNIHSGIIAHKEEATSNLFDMSKRMYNLLPDELKPQLQKSNAKELLFDTGDGKGLHSKIKCMTAGGEGVGRSDTFNNLHISELAFWKGDKEDTLKGLFQAVPNTPDSMIIIESTANGYDAFKTLWDRAVEGKSDYIPLFVGWHELKDYSMPYNGFTLTSEEELLKVNYTLTNDQLQWRRWCIQNNCSGDEESFKQEYPICPEEAFISTGRSVFNKEQIINRLKALREPISQGEFAYDYNGLNITNIRWVENKEGYIKLYKRVEPDAYYVLSGDTAGDGSDSFTGHVLDNTTGQQVAVLKHQFDEDLYTKQMYCLGKHYNTALIGIETNFSSFPIKELTRLGYDFMFVRQQEDNYTESKMKKFGFRTTSITRPVIISELVEICREDINLINDRETLMEMLTFVRNDKGRAEAQQGEHDDLVIALAIGYYIRPQQKVKLRSAKIKPKIYSFGFEQNYEQNKYDKIKIF